MELAEVKQNMLKWREVVFSCDICVKVTRLTLAG